VQQDAKVLAEGLACGDQRRRTGRCSAWEACSWRCAIQICVYFTTDSTETDWTVGWSTWL